YFCVFVEFVFFFSSRRRHTRSKRDWSSDVCSSDLRAVLEEAYAIALHEGFPEVLRLITFAPDGLELTTEEAGHLLKFATMLRLKAELHFPYWDDARPDHVPSHEDCLHEVSMGIYEKLQSYIRSVFQEL